MTKNFYRRHKRACKAGYDKDFCSGEYEERRKGWKPCDCPIFVSGTVDKKTYRQSIGSWNWQEAKAIAEAWGDGPPPPGSGAAKPPQPAANTDPGRITIERAVAVYLEEHQGSSKYTTQRMYGYIMKSLLAWSAFRGYVYLDQWTPGDVREFRASWKVSPTTSTKKITTVRSLFEYAISQEWLTKNPARPTRGIRKRRETEESERTPFSDEELTRMLQACDRYVKEGAEWRYRWNGKDLADFILLAVYTGLRISDLVSFSIDRLQRMASATFVPTRPATRSSHGYPNGFRTGSDSARQSTVL